MIELKNLTFGYKKGQNLFQDLDLSIPSGNIYGLLGKNGAGKTTLLSIISGLLFNKEGEVSTLGFEPGKRQPAFLSQLFFIPEELHVPSMTIKTFLQTYAPFYPEFSHTQFDDFLGEFGLDKSRNLQKLSYGQKKKVMIGFGLASNCKLLILDEPTNGLDIPSKSQFRKLLAGTITDDRIVIISTHQVRDMANLIDPIIVLNEGKVIFQQSIESITSKLLFELQFSEPKGEDVIYYERVPGGYMTIKHNVNGDDPYEEVDMEILFNAIIEKQAIFDELYKMELNYGI